MSAGDEQGRDNGDSPELRAVRALHEWDVDLASRLLERGEVDLARLSEVLQSYKAELEVQNAELRESQQVSRQMLGCYSALFNGLPLAALLVDRTGQIVEANHRAASDFGIPRGRLSGALLRRLVVGEDLPRMNAALHRADSEGHAGVRGMGFVRQRGTPFPGDLHVQRLPGRDGKDCDFACVVVNQEAYENTASQLQESLEALAASERRYRIAADHSPDWDYWYGIDGHFEYISPACERVSGHPPKAFMQDPGLMERIMPPEDAARWRAHQDEIRRRGDTLPRHTQEFHIRRPDGTERWIEHECLPVFDTDGSYLGRRAVNRDITRRREAEQALREREARDLRFSQGIIDSLSATLCVLDEQGTIVAVNRAWREFAALQGASERRTGPGVNYLAICHKAAEEGEADAAKVAEGIQRVLADGQAIYEHTYGMGSDHFIVRISPLHGGEAGARHLVVSHQDITDIKRTETAMRQARDEAERASRAKSEFLSAMSHELRTPMNAILGFAQLLEADPALDTPQQENVQEILKGGRHLLRLINEVLDLSRVESGRLELSPEVVSLSCVAGDCLGLVQPLADEAGITLDPGNPEGLHVWADRGRLKQVLLNLLSNAIKYNRPEGHVRLRYGKETVGEGRCLRIQVIDTGYGISLTRQAELFQPFNRLGADDQAGEGTGIGLALSRRLVEAMGGGIGVQSVEGEGSTFWIVLPQVPEPDGAEEGEDRSSVDTDRTGEDPSPAGEDGSPALTVLCVDDNPANLRLVEQILARRRAHVRLLSSASPGNGLELARVHRPDLILMDINMPDMDGFQVLEQLRARPETARIPVVALTAYASERDLHRIQAAGFTDHLIKPLEVNRFLERLDAWVQTGGDRSF
ncbi:MAG: PAS domain S-box protein [Ectothiorhodospira sp.]